MNAQTLISNLKNYKPPLVFTLSSVWPSERRSAVLVLLFIGRMGELRVILTKRSRGLRSFSGDVSLPGGKADDDTETADQIARREAWEEIGLPMQPSELAANGLAMEYLTTLPCYLSKTFLSVRPLVYFLCSTSDKYLPIERLQLKLNPGETSSLFSVPLNDLTWHYEKDGPQPEYHNRKEFTYNWGGLKWPIKHYYYPSVNTNEMEWLQEIEDLSSDDGEAIEHHTTQSHSISNYKDVWGLTAKIVHDVSMLSHGREELIGHEDLIHGLVDHGGQMKLRQRSPWESGMINNDKKKRYSQVLPRYYLNRLHGISCKY